MTVLTVRNLKAEVHQQLREQAARHGRSMEAEARAILEAGVGADPGDLVSLLRGFAAAVEPSEAELATIFTKRNPESQRPIVLGDDA
ncbi:MAG: FitA-like ribbon-helix-helix domain-containing protein [Leucobacter sp.]